MLQELPDYFKYFLRSSLRIEFSLHFRLLEELFAQLFEGV